MFQPLKKSFQKDQRILLLIKSNSNDQKNSSKDQNQKITKNSKNSNGASWWKK